FYLVINTSTHTITFPKHLAMSDNDFFEFCQANQELDFERDKHGNIIILFSSGSLPTSDANSGGAHILEQGK
ncbi:MAG: hypothetical protein MJA30_02450, partial [Cytophagales bacterium]|nr:hypothetical protein [Cytophagales bacterium]